MVPSTLCRATVGLALGLTVLAAAAPAQAIEQPRYRVERVLEADSIEVRRYEPYIVAEVVVPGPAEQAGNQGFSFLGGYIFGRNKGDRKIAMTAPVTMENQAGPNQWRMFFVMPSLNTLATLPTPLSSEVKLKEIPAHRKAVISFTGFNSQEKTQEKTAELKAWMKSKNLTPLGEPQLARYNPPWSIPFLRRNEVMLDY